MSDEKALHAFLQDLLTVAEHHDILLRWQILALLHNGHSLRTVAKMLDVSLSKVQRGSTVLKQGAPLGVRRILIEEQKERKV